MSWQGVKGILKLPIHMELRLEVYTKQHQHLTYQEQTYTELLIDLPYKKELLQL